MSKVRKTYVSDAEPGELPFGGGPHPFALLFSVLMDHIGREDCGDCRCHPYFPFGDVMGNSVWRCPGCGKQRRGRVCPDCLEKRPESEAQS